MIRSVEKDQFSSKSIIKNEECTFPMPGLLSVEGINSNCFDPTCSFCIQDQPVEIFSWTKDQQLPLCPDLVTVS